MYGGQCVEMGTVDEIFYHPEMPYTWGLLGSMPRMDRTRQARLQPIPGQPPSPDPSAEGLRLQPTVPVHRPRHGKCLCRRCARISSRTAGSHPVRCHIDSADRKRIWSSEIAPKL